MRKFYYAIALLLAFGCSKAQREVSLNDGWTFSLDGGEAQRVTLPHDFSIDRPDAFSDGVPGGNHVGHVKGGTGIYIRNFTAKDKDKVYTLYFDGAYMLTEVSVNGKKIGGHKYGYTPFYFDITSALNIPGDNTIEVKVENPGRNSRWYSGSGLYRDVKIIVTNPTHIKPWGIAVSVLDKDCIKVDVDVEGSDYDEIQVDIKDAKGQVVASGTPGEYSLAEGHLWTLNDPYLYTAEVSLKKSGKAIDSASQRFGLRTIFFDATNGFLLNGEPVNLRGGCVHHDNGFLGAKAIKAAEYHRVKLLKDNGYNAIRCSHNPPSQHFLDACDEYGMLVIDEFSDMWTIAKNPNDYSNYFDECWESDLEAMLLRDRNHPCIIMWSIGNEIPKENIEDGARLEKMLGAKVKSIDTTRPVTEGVPSFLIHGGWANTKDYFAQLDVCGYNYTLQHYESDHELYPDRVIYGSETYPIQAYANWKAAETLPYVVGDFVWSALDYIGEVEVARSEYVDEINVRSMQDRDGIPEGTDPRRIYTMMEMYSTPTYPKYLSWCGDIDIIGEKKPQGLYRDVLWDRSSIEICVHEPILEGKKEQLSPWGWPREFAKWNWSEGDTLQVRVFCKSPVVTLELNGQKIGEKSTSEDFTAVFEVPYQPGELKAVGQDCSKVLRTASEPVELSLDIDKTKLEGKDDLAYIKVSVLDNQGVVVPKDDISVAIDVSGNGVMVASGNAGEYGIDSVNKTDIKLYQGQGQIIVRPTSDKGKIKVSVSADGLKPCSGTLSVCGR